MASPRFAWGIDVGNCALKAIKLVREDGELKIADFAIIEHEQILSNAGDNRESLIHAALASFVEKHPEKGGAVAVAVGGQSSFARFIKLPPVESKKIPEIVRFEAIQQIPFPLDDVEWNYQLFQSPDSPDVEVGIFAMRKELIERHISFFTDVDLNLQTVQMSPLAVYNAMRFDNRLEGTTMLIDLGAENTDLIIAEGETIWLRSIPIGGNSFTEALVKSFKLTFAKAEDLKRNAASSKYARQIFQAMRPVFADLVVEIQRSIGFYQSVHRESQINKVIALGGTFRLPGLQKYLEQNLQLNVQRLNGLGSGAPEDPKLATTFNDNLLGMAGAYGLAVQAMGEATIVSSLLPQRIRRMRMWQEKTKWFAATAALIALGVGVPQGAMMLASQPYNSTETQNIRKDLNGITTDAMKLDSAWSEIEQNGGPDRQQIANAYSLLEYRDLAPSILNDVVSCLPKPLQNIDPSKPGDLKTIPRPNRLQIVIRSVDIKYMPNMTSLLAMTPGQLRDRYADGGKGGSSVTTYAPPGIPTGGSMYGMPPGGPNGMPPGGSYGMSPGGSSPASSSRRDALNAVAPAETDRGFVLIIDGTTPAGDGVTTVQNELVSRLKNIKRSTSLPVHGYVIKSVNLTQTGKVKDNSSLLKEIIDSNMAAEKMDAATSGTVPPTPGGSGPAGRPPVTPRFGAQPGPAGNAQYDPKYAVDRATGESVLEDTYFRVVCLLVVDPDLAPAAASE